MKESGSRFALTGADGLDIGYWNAERYFRGGSAGGSQGAGRGSPTLKLELAAKYKNENLVGFVQVAYLPFNITFHVGGKTVDEFVSNYQKSLDTLKRQWQDQLKDTPFMAFLTENLM